MGKSFLGTTLQIYTTSACMMNCEHCSSRLLKASNMTLATFRQLIGFAEKNGARRIELFANDPLLHPEIEQQVEMLNNSNLGYSILTIGATPNNLSTRERFLRVMEMVDRIKGGFVFSVDYTQKTAKSMLANARRKDNISYPFKAESFWQIAPLLRQEKIPVRINTVITRHNIDEVIPIMSEAATMGFAVSCCFVQNRQLEFEEVFRKGLTPALEYNFRKFMEITGLLGDQEISSIIGETRHIVKNGKIDSFNNFRGKDRSEADIPGSRLDRLRSDILKLKNEFPEKILPAQDFIEQIGDRGFGCRKLLEQRIFPQMKIGTKGQIVFCCDLFDPRTQRKSISDFQNDSDIDHFLGRVRTNPYVWICLYFNTCDFSVNRVVYGVTK